MVGYLFLLSELEIGPMMHNDSNTVIRAIENLFDILFSVYRGMAVRIIKKFVYIKQLHSNNKRKHFAKKTPKKIKKGKLKNFITLSL